MEITLDVRYLILQGENKMNVKRKWVLERLCKSRVGVDLKNIEKMMKKKKKGRDLNVIETWIKTHSDSEGETKKKTKAKGDFSKKKRHDD
jgi:hypothetical protein